MSTIYAPRLTGTFTHPTGPVNVTLSDWSVQYAQSVPPDVEWQGKINDILSVDRKDGSSQVSLTCSDSMTQITGALITGIGSDNQTFRQRAQDLAAASHGITFTLDTAAPGDTYRLGDNVLEGSLADHLNLLCDSVGGIWRPTVDAGVIVSRSITPTVVASFSDEADAPLSYTSLSMSFSTQDVINVLRLRNIGATDDGTGGEKAHVYEDLASIAQWGRRSKEMTTNLFTAAMVDARALELFAAHSQPSYQPTALTYVTDDVAKTPDIHDAVILRRRGVDYTALVVGISQKMSPRARDTDLTTLTLRSLP